MRTPVKPDVLAGAQVGLNMTGITTLGIDTDPDGKTNDYYNPNNGQKGYIWISINGVEFYAGFGVNVTSIDTFNSFVSQMVNNWQAKQTLDAFYLSLVA